VSLDDLLKWAQLASLILIPGVWWAAVLTGKVNRLHRASSQWQTHASKIAVLEERTGGPVVVPVPPASD
jgi:hypothetical protein